MASASTASAMRLSALVCRRQPRLQPLPPRIQHLARSSPMSRRTFSSTIASRKDDPKKSEGAPAEASSDPTSAKETAKGPEVAAESQGKPAETSATPATPTDGEAPTESAEPALTSAMATHRVDDTGLFLASEAVMDKILKEKGFTTIDQWVHSVNAKHFPPATERQFSKELDEIIEPKQDTKSFFFDETDPDQDSEDFEEFNEDDMTEMAHGKLQEVQEMRQYQRLAIWELPLLSKLAKPFEQPTEKTPLRWRYTTYFGDTHPAEKKVVVQFAPDDLGLTKVQANKLKKLCSTRYNPELEIVKMSCESYDSPAQNKRYLAELVDKLVAEAKDPKDTFEDVPLDTRHHKTVQRARFPKEWLMTEDRQKKLAQERATLKEVEQKREKTNQVVDGTVAIENYLVQASQQEQVRMSDGGGVAQAIRLPARSNVRAQRKR